MRIPIISDTHGLLRPELVERLSGASAIIHAGDVGTEAVLDALRALAPLHVVRGNVDHGPWAQSLPDTDYFEISGASIYLMHGHRDITIDPSPSGADVAAVISGHTHDPAEEMREGVLWLNPGSIGPRRFSLPVSMAWLTITPSNEAGARPVLTVEFEHFYN